VAASTAAAAPLPLRQSSRAPVPNRAVYNDQSIVVRLSSSRPTALDPTRFYPALRLPHALRIGRDGFYDGCVECTRGGTLLQCDGPGCAHALHPRCAGLTRVPKGRFFCNLCVHAHNVVA
jgi:hypothetical protein